jgi:hypothetical protein
VTPARGRHPLTDRRVLGWLLICLSPVPFAVRVLAFSDGKVETFDLALMASAFLGIAGLVLGWLGERPRHLILAILAATAFLGIGLIGLVRYLILWRDFTF